MAEVLPRVIDTELPDLIDYFESLIGKETVKIIYGSRRTELRSNFWLYYIKRYKRWFKAGRRISEIRVDRTLIDFGMIVKSIQVFEKDWNTPELREHFVRRLRDSQYAEGLVFELRTGIHFIRHGLDAHWVGSVGDKRVPDLDIRIDGATVVVVECTHRCPRFGRRIWDQKMADDLLAAAKKKLQSNYEWGCARMVVVKVPEEIDWQSQNVRSSLDIATERWRSEGRLKQVNALVFMGKADIIPNFNSAQRVTSFVTDQWAFTKANPDATHDLPLAILKTLMPHTPL